MKKISKAEFEKLTDAQQIEFINSIAPAVRVEKNQFIDIDSGEEIANIYDYALDLNVLEGSDFYNMFGEYVEAYLNDGRFDSEKLETSNDPQDFKKFVEFYRTAECEKNHFFEVFLKDCNGEVLNCWTSTTN